MGGAGTCLAFRRGHIARGPIAKGSQVGNGSVAANLAFLPLVVHDPALARTGSALVQVAVSSHSDEYEVATTRRALHVWREEVIPHGKVWHHFTFAAGFCRHSGQHFAQK